MVQLNDQHIPKVKAYAECNKFTAEAWNALLNSAKNHIQLCLRTSDENATYLYQVKHLNRMQMVIYTEQVTSSNT